MIVFDIIYIFNFVLIFNYFIVSIYVFAIVNNIFSNLNIIIFFSVLKCYTFSREHSDFISLTRDTFA
jgi:hypothetical protein